MAEANGVKGGGRGDDELLAVVRAYWEERDPVPDGLVARMQAAAALAASELYDVGLDIELMLLVERTEELAGARGASTTAYTLRFAHAGVDLLLRISGDGRRSRIDGWVVPPEPIAVTVQRGGGRGTQPGAQPGADPSPGWTDVATLDVGDTGRFEIADLAPGLLRLRLEPNDGSTPFMTPAFEI